MKERKNTMRKIHAKHDNKDRIICAGEPGKIVFFYQPVGSKKLHWLLETAFCPSVFAVFRDKGRLVEGKKYGLTIGELHRLRNPHNPKLEKILERIPMELDYVIRYECCLPLCANTLSAASEANDFEFREAA